MGATNWSFEGDWMPKLHILDAEVQVRKEQIRELEGRYAVRWMIDLDGYAGETTFVLLREGSVFWQGSFFVAPNDQKLSRDDFFDLLEELPERFQVLLQGLGDKYQRWEAQESDATLLS